MDIEQAIEQLDQLAEKVSAETLTLEESLQAFEKSVALAEECLKKLQEYKGKLTVLDEQIRKLKEENED